MAGSCNDLSARCDLGCGFPLSENKFELRAKVPEGAGPWLGRGHRSDRRQPGAVPLHTPTAGPGR